MASHPPCPTFSTGPCRVPVCQFTAPWRRSVSLLMVSLTLASTTSWDALAAEPSEIQFNKQIRPILAEHCFKCHGSDEKARKGKLRLDVRDEAIAKKAILPGDVDHSGMVERIFTADADDL